MNKNLLGVFILLSFGGKAYSQQNHYVERHFDTVFDGGDYFRMHMQIIDYQGFSQIIKDFENSQQQIAKSLSFREEMERRRKEELIAMKRRIDTMRVQAYTNVIGLTEKESAVFWAAYNEYLQKLDEIIERRDAATYNICNIYANLPLVQSNISVEDYVNSFEAEASLKKKYKEKFKTILGDKKLPLLYRAEHQFKMWLLRSSF
jgi:hypothetical protein